MFLTREAGICYLVMTKYLGLRWKKVLSIEDLLLQQKAPYTKLATF